MRFRQLLSAPFLAALETQIFVNTLRNWWPIDPPPASHKISLTGRWLWGLSPRLPGTAPATHSRFRSRTAHCVVCRCPDACRLFRTFSTPPTAVFRPTSIRKLCYELLNVVTFAYIQTSKFCLLYWMAPCWQAVWRVIFVTFGDAIQDECRASKM